MIYKEGSDEGVERLKKRLGMTGDVYMVNNHIANLASHKKLFPESTARNIEAAERERLEYERREEERRQREAEEAEAARKAEEPKEEELPFIEPLWSPDGEGGDE